ncbi:Type II secretory pathway, component PulD [Paraburkholderia caribensis MBA4]|uniref:Type 3 secretion system secretin n=1 Tax=Paraburkholderia caribensis MBA4 TaxID=1323664 RepID=A0A0P0RDG8_9BURK|nr:Type II secretory pathway, component PulD [Paraburkholderia caribensis MBA4]
MLHASTASAAEPVWRAEPMHYLARDTPLADALKEVTSAGGLQVKIARGLKEPVNGRFDELPARVFERLVEAYGLAWYFDGHVIHVSPSSDLRSRTISFAPMKRATVASLLSSLGLADSHLPVRYSDTTAVVSGPSDFVDAVADAIAQAQQQVNVLPSVDETEIRVFPLRYAQAQDITYTSGNRPQVVPGVASLLRKLMADVPANISDRDAPVKLRAQLRAARGNPPPLPSLRGLGLADVTDAIEMLPSDTDPIRTAGTRAHRNIVADARTNSVVVFDIPSMMPNYEHTIAMLDKPQDLVEITAAVIDVSTDAASELGIHWGAGTKDDGSTFGAAVNVMPLPQDVPIMTALPGANLATMIGNSANYLFAKIHALEINGKARILSRPQVLTLNNTEAVLSSRNSVYVRVAGNQDVDLFNVDTGLTLKVTPFVESGSDRFRNVLLNVQIEDGAFDSSLSVDGIPKVNNHSITTQAVVADGESLLVGGYQYERSETSTSQVPVLGDLPYVGALFRDKHTMIERLERLILITPRIRPMANRADQSAVTSEPPSSAIMQPALDLDSSGSPARVSTHQRASIPPWMGALPSIPPLPPGVPPVPPTTKGLIR